MTKLQSALTSLIAAVPACVLAYAIVVAMLFHSDNLTAIAYIVLGGTLISALVTILIPAGILVGARRKPEPVKTLVKHGSGEEIEAIDEGVEVSDSSHGSSGSFDAHDLLEESSEINLGDSDMDMQGGASEAEIDTEPVEDLDDFDLEEIEEEEKPKPKKKKR